MSVEQGASKLRPSPHGRFHSLPSRTCKPFTSSELQGVPKEDKASFKRVRGPASPQALVPLRYRTARGLPVQQTSSTRISSNNRGSCSSNGMAPFSSLMSMRAPGNAGLAPTAATASAVQPARPAIATLPGPVVCVVAQGFTTNPYYPLRVHPCGAPDGATAMQRAVWLQRELRGAQAAAQAPAAPQAPDSAAVSTTLGSSMGGSCEANRGHTVGQETRMPLAPSSTHQEKQQQRQLAAVVPGAGDPMASHVGVKADTVGVFHPERYVRGQPCVEVVGSPPAGMARAAFITCSQFEKLGGGRMARWYRSIYVVQPLQKIEDWLESNDLTVRLGKSRTPRRGKSQGEEQQQEHEKHLMQHSRKGRSGEARTGRQRAARSLSGEQEMQSDEDTSDSGSDYQVQEARAGQYSGRKRAVRGRAGNKGMQQARVAEGCAVVVRESSDVAGGAEAGSRQPSRVALGGGGVASGDGKDPGMLVQSVTGAPQLVTPLLQQPPQLPLLVPQLQQPPLLSQLLALPPQPEDAMPLPGDAAGHHTYALVHQACSASQLALGSGLRGETLPSAHHLSQANPQLQTYEQFSNRGHSLRQQQQGHQQHPQEGRSHIPDQQHEQQQLQQMAGPWGVGPGSAVPSAANTAGAFTPFVDPPTWQQLPQPHLLQQHGSVFPSGPPEQFLGYPYTAGPGNQNGLSRASGWSAAAAAHTELPQAWSGSGAPRSGLNQHPSQLWQQHYHQQPPRQALQQHLIPTEGQPYSRPLRSVSSSLSSSWYVEGCGGPSSSAHWAMPYDDDTPTSAAMPAGPGVSFRIPGAAAYNAPYGVPYPEPAGALPQRPRAGARPQQPAPVYVVIGMPASGGPSWVPALPFAPAPLKALDMPPALKAALPPPRFWQEDTDRGKAYHPVPYGCGGAMEPPPPLLQQQQQQQGGPRWAVVTGWGEDGQAHGHSTCSQYAAPGPYPQGQEAWEGHDGPRPYVRQQNQQWPRPLALPPLEGQKGQFLAVRAPPVPPTAAAAAASAGVVLAGEADCDDLPELHDLFTAVEDDVDMRADVAGGN